MRLIALTSLALALAASSAPLSSRVNGDVSLTGEGSSNALGATGGASGKANARNVLQGDGALLSPVFSAGDVSGTLSSLEGSIASSPLRSRAIGGLSSAAGRLTGSVVGAAAGQASGGAELGKLGGAGKASGTGILASRTVDGIDISNDVNSILSELAGSSSLTHTIDRKSVPLRLRNGYGHGHGAGEAGGELGALGNNAMGTANGAGEVIARNDVARNIAQPVEDTEPEIDAIHVVSVRTDDTATLKQVSGLVDDIIMA